MNRQLLARMLDPRVLLEVFPSSEAMIPYDITLVVSEGEWYYPEELQRFQSLTLIIRVKYMEYLNLWKFRGSRLAIISPDKVVTIARLSLDQSWYNQRAKESGKQLFVFQTHIESQLPKIYCRKCFDLESGFSETPISPYQIQLKETRIPKITRWNSLPARNVYVNNYILDTNDKAIFLKLSTVGTCTIRGDHRLVIIDERSFYHQSESTLIIVEGYVENLHVVSYRENGIEIRNRGRIEKIYVFNHPIFVDNNTFAIQSPMVRYFMDVIRIANSIMVEHGFDIAVKYIEDNLWYRK